MKFFKIFLISVFFFGVSCSTKPVSNYNNASSDFGAWQPSPLIVSDGVILVPQWHLAPQVNTKDKKNELPQFRNQMAIYNQLSAWIQSHDIQTVVVEGCQGDLTQDADTVYNGWSLNNLKQVKKDKGFDQIQTHIGNKIATKFDGEVLVKCGDNLKLIKENQLALSDVRGLSGFKMRLEQSNLAPVDKEKYFVSVKSVLTLPPNTKKEKVLAVLNLELNKSITQFENLIYARNDSFLQQVKSLPGRKVIVIGSLHIQDLKNKLAAQKIPFAIWQPVGLDDGDADLIQQLKAKLH